MIIYNVTIKVEPGVADAWVHWMRSEHMPELMHTGLFIDCGLNRLLEQDETEGITYIAQYFCEGMEQYYSYIDQYAPIMRARSEHLFGGKYVAFRTIMEVIG